MTKLDQKLNQNLNYGACDADQHYYETRDCFDRHIEPKYRDLAIRCVKANDGSDMLMAGDKPFTFLTELNFDSVVQPGTLKDMLSGLSADHKMDDTVRKEVTAENINRDARLKEMDNLGLELILNFPSMAVCVEHLMKDNIPQLYANMKSYNTWLNEDWGFNYKNRIIAPPLLSLEDPVMAVAELDRVLGLGTKAIAMKAGPVFNGGKGRSPFDPIYDTFWAMLNEAKVPVLFHIGESGYNELCSVHWGEQSNPSAYNQSGFQWSCYYGDRPIMEMVAASIMHNLFGRFPNVKMLAVENGSGWVPYILNQMDRMKGMARGDTWIGGRPKGKPSDIFKTNWFVQPFENEPVEELISLIGIDHVLFGSDYPHSEGLANPTDFVNSLPNLSAADKKKVMRENLLSLLNIAL